MESSIEKQSNKEEQKFVEKYGMWILIVGLSFGIMILKFIVDFFTK